MNSVGTLTLSGPNSYTGATTLNGGKIVVTGGGSLGNQTAVNITTATGILDFSGMTATSDADRIAQWRGWFFQVLGSNNLDGQGHNGGTTTFAGVISGTGGSFTKEGAGTMTLTGVNTYTGATTINGGTLDRGRVCQRERAEFVLRARGGKRRHLPIDQYLGHSSHSDHGWLDRERGEQLHRDQQSRQRHDYAGFARDQWHAGHYAQSGRFRGFQFRPGGQF